MRMPIVIIGAGGFAREVYSWAAHDPMFSVVAFVDEKRTVPEIYGLPVFKSFPKNLKAKFLVAIGDPVARARMWDKAIKAGLQPSQSLIHRSAVVGIEVYNKLGCIICPGVILTTNIKIGRGAILNINSTVGHDCNLGEFVTVSPGANISGNCDIGDFSYIGTNASLREKISMGKGSTAGMGAVVLKSIPKGEVWAGNPARQLIRSGLSTH